MPSFCIVIATEYDKLPDCPRLVDWSNLMDDYMKKPEAYSGLINVFASMPIKQ